MVIYCQGTLNGEGVVGHLGEEPPEGSNDVLVPFQWWDRRNGSVVEVALMQYLVLLL